MIEKVRCIAHDVVSNTYDFLENQRRQFQMKEIMKKKEVQYYKMGIYIERYPQFIHDDVYLSTCLSEIEKLNQLLAELVGNESS